MKLFPIPSTVAALLCAAQCLAESKPILVDRAVAEVGGRRITYSEVMAEVRERLFEEGEEPDEKTLPAYYASAISNLVARQLVLLEYENVETKIPEWYFNERLDRIVENGFGGDKSRLIAALSERGISYQEWRRRRREDTIIGTMRQQFVAQNVAARPSDMERIYRENYATNTLPGRIKVSMIAIKDDGGESSPSALDRAREILSKLSTGGSFAALARTHSQESHAANGGSWGFIDPEEEFRPELAAALADLPVGKVAGPIEAGGYVYLLRKDDERADLSIPFSLVRNEIEDQILEKAGQERFDAWVRHLATKHTVKIFDAQ
jgi:peptidyl-prolyl cis-trans isomerase SurA